MNEPHPLRNRWWIVVACVLGLMVGQSTINGAAFGVLIRPISENLGLGRGTFSTVQGLATILTAIASPFFGRMLDRWGIRAVQLPAVVLFAFATAALSLLQASLVVLLVLYVLSGVTAVAQTSAAYSKAISGSFDRQRGLALGLALSGVGLGTATIPQLVSFLVRTSGWRVAYLGLGATILVLSFLPSVLFLREPRPVQRGAAAAAALPGVTLADAMRHSWRFWALSGAMLFAAMTINGSLIHVVPLLRDRGIAPAAATMALTAAGIALIAGRIFSGYCLDKLFGPYIAIAFLFLPMIGIGVLASGAGGVMPFVATVFLGIGIGVEVDLLAFFISRYFGMRAFGALYGFMFLGAVSGNGLGSMLMGWSFQLTHSYTPTFLLFELLLALSCLLLAWLGPYPYPASRTSEELVTAEDSGPAAAMR